MKQKALVFLLISLGIAAAASSGKADQGPKPLFDAVLDFDRDGAADRAVIILKGQSGTQPEQPDGYAYQLDTGESVELAIYLNGGSSPLDISKPASFVSDFLVDEGRFQWVQPMEVTAKGSLKIRTDYAPGASNTASQTLTLVWRGGRPVVAGYTIAWEGREDAGTCDVNLLTGKAMLFDGVDLSGPAKRLKGRFKPVPLEQWSEKSRPKVCDGMG
jgi:hypothetical protein